MISACGTALSSQPRSCATGSRDEMNCRPGKASSTSDEDVSASDSKDSPESDLDKLGEPYQEANRIICS